MHSSQLVCHMLRPLRWFQRALHHTTCCLLTLTCLWSACRCFKSDLTVHKTIEKWSLFSGAWGVDHAELQEVYRLTAGCAGLVHAVQGPDVSEEGTYGVFLKPVGRQRSDAKPCNEETAARAAHGLLHGLAALHEVRNSCKADSTWVCQVRDGLLGFPAGTAWECSPI